MKKKQRYGFILLWYRVPGSAHFHGVGTVPRPLRVAAKLLSRTICDFHDLGLQLSGKTYDN